MICADSGPLGGTVRHPGPRVGWHTGNGTLLPLWASSVLPNVELTPAYYPTDEDIIAAARELDAATRAGRWDEREVEQVKPRFG